MVALGSECSGEHGNDGPMCGKSCGFGLNDGFGGVTEILAKIASALSLRSDCVRFVGFEIGERYLATSFYLTVSWLIS